MTGALWLLGGHFTLGETRACSQTSGTNNGTFIISTPSWVTQIYPSPGDANPPCELMSTKHVNQPRSKTASEHIVIDRLATSSSLNLRCQQRAMAPSPWLGTFESRERPERSLYWSARAATRASLASVSKATVTCGKERSVDFRQLPTFAASASRNLKCKDRPHFLCFYGYMEPLTQSPTGFFRHALCIGAQARGIWPFTDCLLDCVQARNLTLDFPHGALPPKAYKIWGWGFGRGSRVEILVCNFYLRKIDVLIQQKKTNVRPDVAIAQNFQ